MGLKHLEKNWKCPPPPNSGGEDFWAELEEVLRLGGRFMDAEMSYFQAPYTWTEEIHPIYDPLFTYFVIDDLVPMRATPSNSGTIVTILNYNVVAVPDWDENTNWQKIILQDGLEGFVLRKHLRSLMGYRAYFAKKEGNWKMYVFVSGD